MLIDCPPNLYRCTWTAMIGSDYLLIPFHPKTSLRKRSSSSASVCASGHPIDPTLRRLGHLVTRYDKRLLAHRMYEQNLRDMYGGMVMRTFIQEASVFKFALAARTPVQLHDPKVKAAKLTLTLAREILDRIDMDERSRRVA